MSHTGSGWKVNLTTAVQVRQSCEETERRPCDNGVRDQSDASSSQGTLRIANHQELERQGADSLLELSGDSPTDTTTLNFWPPN